MIGTSKNNSENYPENAFQRTEKKPGLSANRPSLGPDGYYADYDSDCHSSDSYSDSDSE